MRNLFIVSDELPAIKRAIKRQADKEKTSTSELMVRTLCEHYGLEAPVRLPRVARDASDASEALALEVVHRMLTLEPVQKEVLDKIETTLRTEFMSTLSHTQRRDSHEQMAEIFTET